MPGFGGGGAAPSQVGCGERTRGADDDRDFRRDGRSGRSHDRELEAHQREQHDHARDEPEDGVARRPLGAVCGGPQYRLLSTRTPQGSAATEL